jgi:CDGSH-type Zn-finger protein
MPRLIRFDRDAPYKIEPGSYDPTKPLWICGCGLTKNPPFCDGAHKSCKNEPAGKLVCYDRDGTTIVEERDDTPTDNQPPVS